MKPSHTMDVAEIYIHFTLGSIESTQSLRVICLAGVGVFENEKVLSLPTSVLNFSVDPETCGLAAINAANDRNFRAAKERENYFTVYTPEWLPMTLHTHNSGNTQTPRNN